MPQFESYCHWIATMGEEETNLHKIYHDNYYGFPIDDDNELFERLVLEINQAGLSWTTILKKQQNFRAAYSNFDIQEVASYSNQDVERLLNDAGIIRNRLKINAAIENAKTILGLKNEFGSFKTWLDHHSKSLNTKEEWTKLFKKTFRFTGGEIVNEFLMSSGYLPGAHIVGCPIYDKVLEANPVWLQKNN